MSTMVAGIASSDSEMRRILGYGVAALAISRQAFVIGPFHRASPSCIMPNNHQAIINISRLDSLDVLIASLQASVALQRRRLKRNRPGAAEDWRRRNLLEVQLAALAALRAVRFGLVESAAARRLDGAAIQDQAKWRLSLPPEHYVRWSPLWRIAPDRAFSAIYHQLTHSLT
ncbi:hypothetical protein [Cupriavidus sp. BIC8F]|uniref:hypothetical protein n=1 Tax=Cupriavidus sp. BIC8F TaxID=3079014 RepID=UPI002916D282|nr:hypothetical protein [Cupriavidus sp. BIC8F]